VRSVFLDIDQRIRELSLVHQTLYNSGDLSRINFWNYLEQLLHVTLTSYLVVPQQTEPQLECEDFYLLISSCRYAFPDQRPGKISLTARRESDGSVTFTSGEGMKCIISFPDAGYNQQF
jgi:two-component sensor histidine kinase